ncbi:MAG: hypothetical protein ABI137_03005 [Antricoccus sp.]
MNSDHSSARVRGTLLTTAAAVVMSFLALVLTGFPAHADARTDVAAAVAKFQAGSHIFLSPAAGQQLDQAALTAKIGKSPIYMAVVGANQNLSDANSAIIKAGLPSATIVVISGTQSTAQSAVLCSGVATKLLSETRAKHNEVAQGELTNWLVDYVAAVAKAPTQTAAKCGATDSGAVSTSPDSGLILPWTIAIGVLGLAGGMYLISRKKKRRSAALRGRHQQVGQLYDQLENDVRQLADNGNPIAGQALADAAERCQVAGGMLSTAQSDSEYDIAHRACLEGLAASQAARDVLGVAQRRDVPSIVNPDNEHLQSATEVRLGEQTYRGYPAYTPGAVHYFDGGGGYLAGWYDSPFWQSLSEPSTFGGLFDDSADFQDDDDSERRSAAPSRGFDARGETDQLGDRS